MKIIKDEIATLKRGRRVTIELRHDEEYAVLREALAEQPAPVQQEPVAAIHIGWDYLDNRQLVATYAVPVSEKIAPKLYTTPQAQPAQQEPVAWRVKVETKLRDGSVDVGYQLRNERLSKYDEPLYTSPAQRTWVGLTQQEVQEIHDTYHKRMGPQEFAAMVEAKLKEKNT